MKRSKELTIETDLEQMPFELDHIQCPNCRKIQSAKIILTYPIKKYLHHCTTCGFVIKKENWQSIQ